MENSLLSSFIADLPIKHGTFPPEVSPFITGALDIHWSFQHQPTCSYYQWLSLRENLQETVFFCQKIWFFPLDFPLNQSND
jgi:hypothetical protein